MGKIVLLWGFLILTTAIALSDEANVTESKDQPEVVQDPKTKTLYYIESDHRHVSAISSDGKLLWVCEPFPASIKKCSVSGIHVGEENIEVGIFEGGLGMGTINKKTGAYTPPGVMR